LNGRPRVVKLLDDSSVALFQYLTTGSHFKQVNIGALPAAAVSGMGGAPAAAVSGCGRRCRRGRA
jgi:hypothetical protein